MPKVLIREYDKSTTGILTENNFAVVVPGYFGEHSGNEEEVLIDHGVYELNSQADFIKYIGQRESFTQSLTTPELEVRNSTATTWSGKYFATVCPEDFGTESSGKPVYIYKAEVVESTDKNYLQSGYLLKTITDTITIEESSQEVKTTYKLTKVSKENIEWADPNAESKVSKTANYCKIIKGNEGRNAAIYSHIGNQMAYELLGLGYVVLFKALDSDLPIETQLSDPLFWEPLKDKSIFNFRYITTGGWYDAAAMNEISKLATFNNEIELEKAETYGNLAGRGDCIALCDIDETGISSNLPISELISKIGNAAMAITNSNQYSTIFGPRVTYVMPDAAVEKFGGNKTFPASFHYLACAARAFERYSEWYAVAGYNRGISNYAVDHTSVKLGEIAINTLAPRKINDYTNKSINLVLHERGNYYLWGNRTAYALDSKGIVFHHFLNIRQLCCTIKKQLYTACRQFTFDPNSDLLWINFVNAIKPTLEAMKADQGIKGYKITKVANDKKALLTANIRIVPIEAVEDFDISIYLEDSLTGIVVNASESEA